MKRLYFAMLALLAVSFAYAQDTTYKYPKNDSSYILPVPDTPYVWHPYTTDFHWMKHSFINIRSSEMDSYIEVDADTDSMEINGDTVKLIRYMVDLLKKNSEQSSKREDGLYRVLSTSVLFTNTVPDPYKTNKSKAWLNYLKAIKPYGYYVTTEKKKNK